MIGISSRLGTARQLGCHRIATSLREKGWDIEVVDWGNYWPQDKLRELFRQRYDSNLKFIGFSYIYSDTDAHANVEKFATWIREQDPNLLLVGGGQWPHDTQFYFDYFVAGYGEVAIEVILKHKFSNGPAPEVEMFGTTKVVNATELYPAYPDRSSMVKYEDRDFIAPGEWGQIEFSRGCKFKCRFCSYPLLGVNYDACRTVESAREQLMDAYDRYGIENYSCVDETFNDKTEKIIKFADMVETLPWKPYFSGGIRADLLIARPDDKDELIRMGMYGHYHGIESLNPKTAKFINKGMQPDRLKQGLIDNYDYFVKHSPKRLYRVGVNFIAGLPYETLESLDETYQWIDKYWRLPKHVSATVFEINTKPGKYNHSYISTNLEVLGYKPMDGDINKIKHLTNNVGKESRMIWQNDYMNILQAQEWCSKLDRLHTLNGLNFKPLEPSEFSELLVDDDGNILSFEKKLLLTNASQGKYLKNAVEIFIPRYIEKKLGAV